MAHSKVRWLYSSINIFLHKAMNVLKHSDACHTTLTTSAIGTDGVYLFICARS